MNTPSRVAIGLGSNIGDRAGNLRDAYQRLRDILDDIKVSSAYLTPPVGNTNQEMYGNAVVSGLTKLSPEKLLATLKRWEREMGRGSSAFQAPRIIDFDILLYEDVVLANGMQIPHPRLAHRWFALGPLKEVWPEARHPALRTSVQHLLSRLPRPPGVEKMPVRWHEVPPLNVRTTDRVSTLLEEGFAVLRERVAPRLLEEVLTWGDILLSQPDHTLKDYARGPEGRSGYIEQGGEQVAGRKNEDRRRAWDFPFDYALHTQALPIAACPALVTVEEECQAGITYVARVLEKEAGQPLTELVEHGDHLLRINRFTGSKGIVFPSHLDFGPFTVFVGETQPDLQVIHEGRWARASLRRGDFLIGNGTLLREYVSGVPLLRHRIVSSGLPRTSLVCFTGTSPGVKLPSGLLAQDVVRAQERAIRSAYPS